MFPASELFKRQTTSSVLIELICSQSPNASTKRRAGAGVIRIALGVVTSWQWLRQFHLNYLLE